MIGVSQPADFTSISVITAPGINVWIQQRLIWDACCYGKLPECSAVMRQKSKLSTFNGQIWAVFLGNSFYYFYTLDKIGVLMEWISLCAAPFFGRCLHRLGVPSCSQSCSWALFPSALNTSRNDTPRSSPGRCLLFFTCIWDKIPNDFEITPFWMNSDWPLMDNRTILKV